ncbi:MAG TPA: hypothetical protein VLC46_03565 [Thermoanaerobaculia bacterium]|jgi:hypothetical protein|nr:hypothetical protein [Thermoanaerobaculia bacterium]
MTSAITAPRMFLLSLAVSLAASSAFGDPLSDLREVLRRYPAKSSFSATVQVIGDTQGVSGARNGSTSFDVEDGPGGLTIHVSANSLAAAEAEADKKKRDPDSLTPTRSAMVALTVFDVIDALDSAAMLLDDLNGATLLEQKPAVRDGKTATLLRIKVKPTLATARGRFVNEPTVELRVWIDANGLPVAAERDSNYSASILFLKAGNVRKEQWKFAVLGDRLYASRNDQDDQATALGKSIVTSRSATYVPR